jgi:hypothetical protein
MTQKPIDIDSLTNPLASMMQQSQLAFDRCIRYAGTLDGKKAYETHLHMEEEIKKYIETNKAPWLLF